MKDAWTITDDPYIIQYHRTTLYADLSAERPIAAQRDGQKLVVEAKSFVGTSKIQDLKEALGQYDIYRYLGVAESKYELCDRFKLAGAMCPQCHRAILKIMYY